ncbi:hypothetical protein SDC9_187409 [bioreactor metagenome]|uniref:Uncharacterized protein n=1 Tax=bioreactor metagenome TaxID=1076179 RepID=A0A645HLF9_9ZZZZ
MVNRILSPGKTIYAQEVLNIMGVLGQNLVPFVVCRCHRIKPVVKIAACGQRAEKVGNAAALVASAEDKALAVQVTPVDLGGHRVFRHKQAAVAGNSLGGSQRIVVGGSAQGIGVNRSHIGEGHPFQTGVGQLVVYSARQALTR